MTYPLEKYLSSHPKTRLIIDFDETIIKLDLPWENAIRRIREQLISLDSKICKEYELSKLTLSELQNAYVQKFGYKALKLFLINSKQFENEELKGYRKNKDLIDFIKDTNDFIMLLWSSNSGSTITRVLQELDIFNKFKKIVSREDVRLLKPYAEGFDKLHEKNISKKEYLLIGDSKHDKAAAEKAGVDFYLEDYFKVPGKYW